MKYILSWGGGVNSTAILAMIKLGMLPELNKDNTCIVFADTGAEMPYTYEHTSRCLHPMTDEGWKVKVLRPWIDKEFYTPKLGLPEYCIDKQVMPSRVNRWCTMEFKSKPIRKFRESLCSDPKKWDSEVVLILGIASDEMKRAKFLGQFHTKYPLINHNLDRKGCIELIKKAGLPEARKSGCYLCPFQGKDQWIELFSKYPEYFAKTEELENIAREKYKGDAYFFVRDLPLREQIEKWRKMKEKKCQQKELFGLERHCLCEF